MNVLVVGNGGREHALCWKLKRDDPNVGLYCAPGNAGTAALATNVDIAAEDVSAIVAWARAHHPDLTLVGPEVPLCAGLADALAEAGLRVFGPGRAAARLEGSKQFAKEIMRAANVPTARAHVVTSAEEARAAVAARGLPVVLKADGLAAGKGVMVCTTSDEVAQAIQALLVDRIFGAAGDAVLVEEFLEGEEVSMLAFVDGATVVPMAPAQDHKRLKNGDEGPNTGGMGAYSPAPAMTPEMQDVVLNRIFRPVVGELATRGIEYKGVLYAGLMLTRGGPKVIEFNCRFGDPETQCILPRMAAPLAPVLQACIDGRLTPELVRWSAEACVCVVMVAGGYPGKYEKGAKLSGIAEAAQTAGVTLFHAGTALRGGAVVTNGGRVLGVTAVGPTVADAVRTAYHAVIRVKFDRAHYRTDIAHHAL